MEMARVCLVLLLVLLVSVLGCDSESSGDGTTVMPPTNPPPSASQTVPASLTPNPTQPSPLSACFADEELIEKALDAYHAANGTWPSIDGRPGDIQWEKLVPAFIDHVPATDTACDWQVNTAPEGAPCIRDKANKGSDCYCASVCTGTATAGPSPRPTPTPTTPAGTPPISPTTPISSMKTTGGLVWATSWDEAQRVAQSENKPIMIVFYTDVCPYCKKLFNNTLPDEQLSLFLSQNFVTIKSNTQKEKLNSAYSITAVPTTVFVTPQGEELPDTRITGNRAVDPFRAGAEKALSVWAGKATADGDAAE
ncbi:MAG: DUF255 domain-containing protein [Chloroflexi bacterium]|nr:DUF255 domain-containing protein [Chloroflexota bacterium]